jgi:ATP-dependent exoDNAse (exonuclease V) beta subunit
MKAAEPYSVVWWDPGALTLGTKAPFGMRREDLIVRDVPRHVVADGRSRYDRWKLARISARSAGSVPSVQVQTARAWSAVLPGSVDSNRDNVLIGIETSVVDGVPRRGLETVIGRGPVFGVLVHAVLAQAAFDADRQMLQSIADVEARILGLGPADVDAAAERVEQLLKHDLIGQARAATARGACRRETPVTCRLPDGQLVEGIVDLAFEAGGRWTVVDYKTDRELAAEGTDRYRRQVALYAAAIARATGAAASGVILRV